METIAEVMQAQGLVYQLVLMIHVLLFVYWLGGDLGVFYSSGFLIRPELSRETRLVAAKIMFNLDLVPRICMSLMLTVGGILSEAVGLVHPPWQMAGIILLGPVWLSMVLFLHFRGGTEAAKKLTKIDFWFRWVVVFGVIASVGYSWSTGWLHQAPWVAGKLLVFAALVFCGIMIRMRLKPFTLTFHKIVQDQVTDADNQAMIASLGRVRPWVIAIWVGLVWEAYLGTAKPGSPDVETLSSFFPLLEPVARMSGL